ncbi:MAG TPA: hypothetical protein VF188_08250 [Longimicrobiales bacterium]
MMPKPIRLDGLLAKVETTYGEDAAPSPATDAVRVSERVWSSITLEYAFPGRRDDAASGSLIPLGPVPRKGRIVTVNIAWEARGAGAAYSASVKPEASALLRACGLEETLDATAGSEAYTYAPADEGHESCTIYAYAGGNLYKIVGCRGTVTWPVEVGAVAIIRFQMQGLLVEDPVAASLPAITYQAQLPPVAAGMVLTVGSWTPAKVFNAEFAEGAEIQRIDDATADDAVREFAITQILPSYRLQAYAADLGTYNPYAQSQAAAAVAIQQTLGTQQYNKVALDTSEAYVEAIAHTEQNQFTAWDLTYQVRDFTIAFR